MIGDFVKYRGKHGAALLVVAILLSACGGGSSGSPPPVVSAPVPPTSVELAKASQFASRATFGLPYAGIESIAKQGRQSWLEQQFQQPMADHTSIVTDLVMRREAGEFTQFEQDLEFLFAFRRFAWWHRTLTGSDMLRQRTAFALSEIFVVSDKVDVLAINPFALSTYYDMLLGNAFGNYRELLLDVTLHPAMGIYLSHINNRKADPARNIFPDENFAREIMQLFSIGLFELNIDGSVMLDGNSQPIPTYSNTDIREFAKIFTGLSFGGPDGFFGNPQPNFLAAMQMYDDEHEPGEKLLLHETVVAAGQSGMQDIETAIDTLFNHANVGPFFGKQLIQRLVTSNPSSAYVERVARAFNGESGGVRGDMKAVLAAVLLDPEAMAISDPTTNFGKLREPVVRYASILRQFGASSSDGFLANTGYFIQEFGKQHPLSAPSVFNFYLPAHSPPGEIANGGLAAPEFQITTSSSIVAFANLIDYILFSEFVTDVPEPFAPASLNLDEYLSIAHDVPVLVDRLDTVLTAGTLSAPSRQAIESILDDINEPDLRLRIALYMFLISADYAVRL